ncbi:MAG: DUF359 domain-containing protein [archaeon]|nr:DUF359 domain-containing protein [archaeon]
MLKLDAELNKDLISELKIPLGKLYPKFEEAIEDIKVAEFLISVGDETYKNLIKNELYPNIGIIDNLIQRKNHNHDLIQTDDILEAINPAGTITEDLWETIEQAISLADVNNQLIIVDGEEDLAVLPCIRLAPEETTILYGQPNEGLVLLKVSDVKEKAQELLEGFIKE